MLRRAQSRCSKSALRGDVAQHHRVVFRYNKWKLAWRPYRSQELSGMASRFGVRISALSVDALRQGCKPVASFPRDPRYQICVLGRDNYWLESLPPCCPISALLPLREAAGADAIGRER